MTVTKLLYDRTNCICNSFLFYYYDDYTPATFVALLLLIVLCLCIQFKVSVFVKLLLLLLSCLLLY